MKRLLTLMAVALISSAAMAQAVIKFEKTNHNFGSFKKSEIKTCEFVFTNTGDKPLVIQQAYGSCGCTVPKYPEQPIAPGAKAAIKVAFNGKSQFKGPFKKSITIRSNASNNITRVYIEGSLQEE